MKITWIGHSCFKIESKGYTVILDPYADGSVEGLGPVREEADLVLCSHEHGDHNGRSCITLRKGADSPFTIEKIETYHDDKKGIKRGPNTIHILDDGECRVAHFGDLGCALTPEQADKLRDLDVALIPVGGFFTIDAGQARKLAEELRPGIVVPMHFRSGSFGFDVLDTVEAYTALCSQVQTVSGSVLEITEGQKTEDRTVVLTPQNAGN